MPQDAPNAEEASAARVSGPMVPVLPTGFDDLLARWRRLSPGQRAGALGLLALAIWPISPLASVAAAAFALHALAGTRGIKLMACVGLDAADFTIGRLLGFGIAFGIGCAAIACALWGRNGLWHLWEVLDVTEQFDSFVPTCTMIALKNWNTHA